MTVLYTNILQRYTKTTVEKTTSGLKSRFVSIFKMIYILMPDNLLIAVCLFMIVIILLGAGDLRLVELIDILTNNLNLLLKLVFKC